MVQHRAPGDRGRAPGTVRGNLRRLQRSAWPRRGLASHADVVKRAAAAVERINDRLEAAKADGLLRCFNRAYAARRQDARRRGETFMPYNAAFGRLRRELYKAVAGDSNAGMIERALGGVSDTAQPHRDSRT
jgi:hypothetical protein